MTNHSGILGKILAHGVDSVDLLSNRQFTEADIVRLSEQAASQWRDTFANLLSAFELNGELGCGWCWVLITRRTRCHRP